MASQEKTGRTKAGASDVITIKKYANRRLYNTATSSYVTLDYLAEMVREGQDFVVFDAKSGEDITRSVLTQIIFEEENKGQNLLPVKFLRQLIGYYGDNLQSFVPSYLEVSMETFQKNQEAMRKSLSEKFGNNPGFKMFEDVTRQNMAMFQQGMKMFGMDGGVNPWTAMTPKMQSSSEDDALSQAEAENAELHRQIAELKAALAKAK